MKITIECDHCHALYSISEPLQVGGVAHVGTKVSTEIGCPKCQEPNGTVAARESSRMPSATELERAVIEAAINYRDNHLDDRFNNYSAHYKLCEALDGLIAAREKQ